MGVGVCKERAQEGMHGLMGRDRRGQRLKRDTVGGKAWPCEETNAAWGAGLRPLKEGLQSGYQEGELPSRNPKSPCGSCSQKERAAGLYLAHRDPRAPGEVGDPGRQSLEGKRSNGGRGVCSSCFLIGSSL